MDIYDLLRFLISNCRPEVENPARNYIYDQLKKAGQDLVDELQNINAFGTMAAVKKGTPYHE